MTHLLIKIVLLLTAGMPLALWSQATLHVDAAAHMHLGSAQLVLDSTHFHNEGYVDADSSTLYFVGEHEVEMQSNGMLWHNITLRKSSSTGLRLLDDLNFRQVLDFWNFITLDTADLVFHNYASMAALTDGPWIETNGTGQVVLKQGRSFFYYPVGPDRSTFLPVYVEYGFTTPDTFGLRCVSQVYENGLSGSAITADVVAGAWLITEQTPGGNQVLVNPVWNSHNSELSGFDRTDCGIMHFKNGIWNLPVTAMTSAIAFNGFVHLTDYYQTNRTVDSVGLFAVGGTALIDQVKLNSRAYLQGPFQFGSMSDQLRSKNLIPLQEPYTALGYTHKGRGGGETIAASVLTTTGLDAIVDWVVLELRDKNNSATVLETHSALLQRDGDIVDLDGTSSVAIPVLDDDYFLAVRHRNHLGVRTPQTLNLSKLNTSIYDFTIAPGQAYGTNSLTEVAPDQWALWGGNVNGDAMVRMTGPTSINDFTALLSAAGGSTGVVFNTYERADVNMDGNIRNSGPPTINDFSRLLSMLGGFTNIRFEQF